MRDDVCRSCGIRQNGPGEPVTGAVCGYCYAAYPELRDDAGDLYIPEGHHLRDTLDGTEVVRNQKS